MRYLLLFAVGLLTTMLLATPVLAQDVSVYDGPNAITATGEPFLPYSDYTAAAMPMWPEGSLLRVCREDGVRCVNVRVNDATPIAPSFDISWAAGQAIGLTDGAGRCDCSVTPIYVP